MTPILHPFCNDVLAPPAGQEKNVNPLHIQRHDAGVVSFWTPNEHERGIIESGGCVALHIYATTHPPVLMTTVPHLIEKRTPAASGRINELTATIAAHVESSGLGQAEIAVAFGILIGQLAEHSCVPLFSLLSAIGDAARALSGKRRRNPSSN